MHAPAGSKLAGPSCSGHGPERAAVQERWEEADAELMPAKGGAEGQKDPARAAKRFLAFSTGPRQCLGQSLARMLHDLGVAMLCSRFHFSLDPRVRSQPQLL